MFEKFRIPYILDSLKKLFQPKLYENKFLKNFIKIISLEAIWSIVFINKPKT